MVILGRISAHETDVRESERLARRWFTAVTERAFEEFAALVHPAVVVVSKIRPGQVIQGRDDVVEFARGPLADSLYEAVAMVFRPLDDERIIVEGRIRWIDDERVMRDDPVTWAMEFRDGLLIRFASTRTQVEAESLLARPVV